MSYSRLLGRSDDVYHFSDGANGASCGAIHSPERDRLWITASVSSVTCRRCLKTRRLREIDAATKRKLTYKVTSGDVLA